MRTEYQKLCQAKRAKVLSIVKTELQENRKSIVEFFSKQVPSYFRWSPVGDTSLSHGMPVLFLSM